MNGYCKIPDCNKPAEGTTGLCSSHNKALRKVVKPTLRKRGENLTKKMEAYHNRRVAFLRNKRCAVYPTLPATEIHHQRGRIGDLLLDDRYWLPVSRKGHVMITLKPAWALKSGYSLPRNTTV